MTYLVIAFLSYGYAMPLPFVSGCYEYAPSDNIRLSCYVPDE